MHDDLVPPTARVYAEMPPVEDHSDFLPMEQEGSAEDADYHAYHQDAELEHAPPRIPAYTTASFDLDAAFSRSRDAEAEAFGEPQPQKRSMEVLRHDFIADAHRAKLKAAAKPDMPGFDPRPARRRAVGEPEGHAGQAARAPLDLLLSLAEA